MKKRLFASLMALVMMAAVMLPSCVKKAEDLEGFLNNDPETAASIQDSAKEFGMDAKVTGNEIVLTYDLKNAGSFEEENLKDPVMIEAFEKILDEGKSTFVNEIKSLEDTTGYSGIKMTVNFTYGEETLVSRTFSSQD